MIWCLPQQPSMENADARRVPMTAPVKAISLARQQGGAREVLHDFAYPGDLKANLAFKSPGARFCVFPHQCNTQMNSPPGIEPTTEAAGEDLRTWPSPNNIFPSGVSLILSNHQLTNHRPGFASVP